MKTTNKDCNCGAQSGSEHRPHRDSCAVYETNQTDRATAIELILNNFDETGICGQRVTYSTPKQIKKAKSEHAALIAVAEAVKEFQEDNSNDHETRGLLSLVLDYKLANLAAVQKGGDDEP